MPLTEVDPNIIRHDSISRSSNVSGKTSHKDGSQQAPSTHSDKSAHPAGVLSMLKTTTETGDIGAFSMRQNRLHQIPNASSSRRQAGADPSRTSSHYSRTASIRSKGSAQSKASNRSTHDQLAPESWPYNYHPHASSLDLARGSTGLAASNGNLQPVATGIDKHDPEYRAFSLTKTLPPNRTLSKHRSAASLRSQPSTFARPHSPYMYPTRLRRPGFRPDSPALSESNGLTYNRLAARRPAHGIHAFNIPPVPQNRSDKPLPHPALSRLGQHGPRHMTMENPRSDSHQPASWRQNTDSVDLQFWQKIGTTSPFETSQRSHNGQLPPGVSNPSPLKIENSCLSPDSPNRMREEERGPYVGFVQRVKQALEERVSMEELRRKPKWDSPKRSIPEEKESDLAETHDSPLVKRLTRDMIKAAIGPPSDPGVASSPEGADHRRTDESIAEDSSAGAGPSLELSRTTPDPPIDAQPSVPLQIEIKGREEERELKITLTAPSTPPDQSEIEASLEADLEKADSIPNGPLDSDTIPAAKRSQEKQEALDERPNLSSVARSPGLNRRSENKHTSLPEARASKPDPPVENHVSLPVFSSSTNLMSSKLASGSWKSGFPTWSHGNEGIASVTPVTPATGPSSAHSSFDTLRTSTGDIDVPTWATSSVKVRIRAKANQGDNSGHDHRISEAESHDNVAFLGATTLPARIVVDADNSTPVDAAPVSNSFGSNDRLSAMKQFHFPLPDLAEDSQEDASTTNLRMLGSRRPDFRTGGMKQPRRENKGLLQAPVVTESPASYVSRKLAYTRNMPSLNFSQMDLTTKLNLALNIRSSHSTETLRSRPEQETRHSGTEQLSSPALMRERYKSFFSDGDMVGEVEDTTTELPSKRTSTAQKHLSNEELMTEIERLSIPSVNGLTVRLSELLPTIKSGNSDAGANSGEDSHNGTKDCTGDRSLPERMESVEGKKIAVASSLTAGRIAKSRRSAHGAHSPLHRQHGESSPLERLMKDLPPLPKEEQGLSEEDNMLSDDSRNLPAELEATVPLCDTNTRIGKLDSQIDTRDNESTTYPNHQSKEKPIARSMTSTPDSRPWNKESNYPWEDQSPAIEISPALPEREDGRSLIRDISERNSRAKTPTGLSRNTTERIVRSMSPGPHVDNFLVPQSQLEDELEQSGNSRSGIIGSIQRKIGMKSRIDKAGFPVDAIFLHPEERFTEPGDRYPTTGLTPPSHVNMDEARSYFSDDSSEHERERVGMLRKRLTKMRQRQPGARQSAQWRSVSQSGSRRRNHIRSMVGANTRDSNSEQSNVTVSNPNVVAVYDQPPAGMSKLEYRAKRIVEKLRIFWCRSGKVIRSMSRANRHPHIFYEPDLYEGV